MHVSGPARGLRTRVLERRRVAVSNVDVVSVAVAFGIAAGIALRVWVLRSELGALDADEAVWGLMARHALDGEFTVFFWLQAYGGSQNALLIALAFAVAGASTLAVKLVNVLLYAAAAVLVWRVGRRLVGEPAGRLSGVLFWIWPPFFVWFSTKAYAYSVGLVCALAAVVLCLRLAERPSRIDAAGLGLALGLGWWSIAQVGLILVLPWLVWLVWRRRDVLRLAWIVLPASAVGAAPWLVWNVKYDWLSLHLRPEAGVASTYADRLADFFTIVLPTWLGVRVPFSLEWLTGRALGVALVGAAVLALVYAALRRPAALAPMFVSVAVFPLVAALSPFAYYVDTPRYAVILAPALAVLFAYALSRNRTVALAAIGGALALSVAGLVRLERDGLHVLRHDRGGIPKEISPLIGLLERERATRVLADYWLAYRISFESDERVIATSTGFVRYVPHDRLVRAVPFPAHVYLPRDPAEAATRSQLLRRGYRRVRLERFVVYLPPRTTDAARAAT
jgi:4-amino-4-deoxy-L-arabinose transferase-like glycosyltransferase